MNEFTYRGIYNLGEWVYSWEVNLEGKKITGTSTSIPRAFREAKKAVKRHRKMKKFLNE